MKSNNILSLKCPICSYKKFHIYRKNFYKLNNKDYSLIKCKNCSLVFVNPFPSPAEIKKIYQRDYFDECFDSGLSEGGYLGNKEKLYKKYKPIIKQIKKYKHTGKLLEIGCAGGYFLEIAKQNNFICYGIEISKDMGDIARQKKLEVFTGTLEQIKFDTDFFDVIYMGHVLEHVTNPVWMIKECKRILKENGILVISVPCFINSIYYIILKIFYEIFPVKPLKMFKIRPEGKYLIPYHLLEFSPKALKKLLSDQDFAILKMIQDIPVPDIVNKPKNLKMFILKIIFFIMNLYARLGGRGGQICLYARNLKSNLLH